MNTSLNQAREFIAETIEDKFPKFGKRTSPLAVLGWFVAGAVVGSAAMYLLDPTEGKKRRDAILQKGSDLKDDAFRLAESTSTWKDSALSAIKKISGLISGTKDEEPSRHLAAKETDPSYLH